MCVTVLGWYSSGRRRTEQCFLPRGGGGSILSSASTCGLFAFTPSPIRKSSSSITPFFTSTCVCMRHSLSLGSSPGNKGLTSRNPGHRLPSCLVRYCFPVFRRGAALHIIMMCGDVNAACVLLRDTEWRGSLVTVSERKNFPTFLQKTTGHGTTNRLSLHNQREISCSIPLVGGALTLKMIT